MTTVEELATLAQLTRYAVTCRIDGTGTRRPDKRRPMRITTYATGTDPNDAVRALAARTGVDPTALDVISVHAI